MPKFLIEATYTPEGFRGLQKDRASGRREAVSTALDALGAKLESMHFAFGERDVIVIVEAPDNITAAALGVVVCAAGGARTNTTPLLTIEEADQALSKKGDYRPPGG
jgi:uncharacterized protein with GYD domain